MRLGAVTPDTNEWVTPVEVSYVSSEYASAQGDCGPGGRTDPCAMTLDNAIAARITAREPVAPMEANGSVTEKICPLPTVKLVAEPMREPLEL